MEKPLDSLQAKSRLRIKVSPKLLREAADRLEAELKANTLKNQEAELDFTRTITFFSEIEPEAPSYTSFSSEAVSKTSAAQGKSFVVV